MGNFKERIKGITLVGLFFGSQLVSVILVMLFLVAVKGISPDVVENYVLLYTPFFDVLIVGFLAYRYRSQIKATLESIRSNKMLYLKKLVFYFVIFIAVLELSELIDKVFFTEYLDVLGENEEFLQNQLETNSSFFMIISLSVLSPIFEECVFRYGVMNKVLIGMNRYVAAVIATIFFSFIHIGFDQMLVMEFAEFIHVALLYFPSIVLGMIFARENNLLFPILFHIYNNAASIL